MGIVLSVFTLQPIYATAPTRGIEQFTPRELVAYYAEQFQVSQNEMEKTITCESSWSSTDVGDHGLANGIAQFHKSTFDMWARQKGETLDYTSTHDQIKLMAWAFSKGESYKHAWTCWTKNFDK